MGTAGKNAYLALRASAGSGKTFALVLRYVALLLKGARAHEILALTFTNKAALQMQERIIQALENLLSDGLTYIQSDKSGTPVNFKNNNLLKALEQEYALEIPTIAKHISQVYTQFLQDNAQIMTIDAFLQKVLRKFSYFVGVSASFKVSYLSVEDKLLGFLLSLKARDMHALRGFCQRILDTGDSFNAIHALGLILELYYSGISVIPPTILSTPDIATLEAEILHQARALQGKIKKRVSTPRAQNALKCASIQEVLKSFKPIIEGATYLYFKKYALQDLTPDFQALQENIALYYQVQESLAFKDLNRFLSLYQAHTHSPTQLDFNAIALKAHALLAGSLLDRDFFYFRLDSRISHILVDEFQDTSVLQYQILKPLIDEIKAGKGQNLAQRSVFFVGDVKQSIYGFRGSYSDLFKQVCGQFHSKPLTHNYRSDKNILAFVNTIFSQVFTDYESQEPYQDAQEGYVKVRQTPKEDLLKTLTQEVCALLQKRVDPSEITILCFKNQDAICIKDHLLEAQEATPALRGVPIISETDTHLLAQREAKILMHALKHALAPQEYKPYHRACMLKLLGLPLNASLDVPAFNANLGGFVLALMRHFQLYSPPARHFLELSLAHHDPTRFIEVLEKEDLGFSHQSAQGIKVMTIHKSKGMEFGHVLVVEPLGGSKADTSKFFTLYQKGSLTPFYRQKGREHFDLDYAQALQAFKERQSAEEKHVRYVACTRAKHSLILVQQTEKSAFESLQLQPLEKGTIVPSPTPPHTPLLEDTPALLDRQRAFGRQDDHLQQTQEDSHFSSEALRFGEVLHKALELHYGYGIDRPTLKDYLGYHYGFQGVDIDRVLARLETLEHTGAFQALLHGDIAVELSFKTGRHVIRMDMLVSESTRLCILDYKSGESYQNKHRQQILAYQQSVQRVYPDCQVQGVLIYALESGVQVRPL
ncbi:RecB-like helicase [Helicobacter baculiformis]|uniref:DNA 3'-5' helicase n=1 Tax=Helicobacter baculiformis TaxID=427351 RepID=A0ABV7ZKT2_9HELI|nr:RecB-like helicase [Helicobacter baculiformis]